MGTSVNHPEPLPPIPKSEGDQDPYTQPTVSSSYASGILEGWLYTHFTGDETEAPAQINPASSWQSWASNQGSVWLQSCTLKHVSVASQIVWAVPYMIFKRILNLSKLQPPHL